MSDISLAPDAWESPQRILVVLAHPDDPEFFCGATLARWTNAGHTIVYWLLTCGDKGSDDREVTAEQLCGARHVEQHAAAGILGVKAVHFLDYPDGHLVPDLHLRKDITRIIRRERPDILLTCDPQMLYFPNGRINHPDHRAAGLATLDAVFPAARNHRYFPELLSEGFEPHAVREVWVSLPAEPDIRLDVTVYWEVKIRALQEHLSQIGDRQQLAERMRARHTSDSTPEAPRYEEAFKRIIF
jgi:LmbE family N-acetylglucosaminyl deacetylase